MMAKYRITAPDGNAYEVTAPDDATQEQVLQYAQQNYQSNQENPPQESIAAARAPVASSIKDALGGFARSGMGIASNLMRPIEALIPGGADFDSGHKQRMARVEGRFSRQGYDQDSLAFQGGKLGGDVLATLPVGGVLAKGATAIKMSPKVATALNSGGFKIGQNAATKMGRVGDAALRVGSGAAVGGTQAGMVNLDDAGTGALVGGAMPGAFKVAGEAGKLVKRGGSALVKNTIGLATGAGADTVGAAYQSGKAGNRAFLDSMRGDVPADDIVAQAKSALQNMRAERAATYRSGMVDVKADKSVIDFAPINKAINGIRQMGSFKGQAINKNASGTVDEITDTVNTWAALDPAEYHTPEGLDALKQAIGDIRDSTQFGTPGRRAADQAYNAVKAEINKQAPTYSKVMKDYADASEALKEVEKTFSLGDKASKDTSLRKLLSLMRNNVNTNFSNRGDLAQRLVDNGAGDLLPTIAGKSMNSITPRGLQGMVATGTGLMGLSNPAFLATLPLQSPRLMGEAAYGMGRAAGATTNAGTAAAKQLGLLNPKALTYEQALLRTLPLLSISTSQ